MALMGEQMLAVQNTHRDFAVAATLEQALSGSLGATTAGPIGEYMLGWLGIFSRFGDGMRLATK